MKERSITYFVPFPDCEVVVMLSNLNTAELQYFNEQNAVRSVVVRSGKSEQAFNIWDFVQ